jgi:hypothetical protein
MDGMGVMSKDLDWTCGDPALDRIVHEQLRLIADAIGVDASRVTAVIGSGSAEAASGVPGGNHRA